MPTGKVDMAHEPDVPYQGDVVRRDAGNFVVNVVPRGVPLWLGDGGGFLPVAMFYLALRILPRARGYVVGVRWRRRFLSVPRVVAFERAATLEEANAVARRMLDGVNEGRYDHAVAIRFVARRHSS
jgi:hypothetical protein